MSLTYSIFKEPLIEFRHGQALEDPHDGLSLFGPFDADSPSHPKKITYGVISTKEGLTLFEEWSKILNSPQISEPEKLKLWPPFPGFEAAFTCEWPDKPAWSYVVNEEALINASRHRDRHERAYGVVNIYMEGFKILEKRDEDFNVIICVVPEEVHKNCRPKSRPDDMWGYLPEKKVRDQFKKGLVTLFDDFDDRKQWSTDKYGMSPDFRRQIKARALKYNVPIQIIRETTLSLENYGDENRRVTCLSDRAWNLSTGLYYKAGGKPWRLASAREGVCYIGISFRKTDTESDNRTACCAAQMFLDSGDGIVFLGDKGPWYSPKKKQYYLSKEAAYNLLSGILKTYGDMGGEELRELFIHCRSRINKDAFEGYKEACPEDVKLVGVRVKKERNDLRLYRPGKMPVIRGSFIKWNDEIGYLWGTGFKPRLETYDGWEVPIPLKIIVQYGETPVEQVALDIYSLTKLNYNACKLGDSEPVTIMFSDDVGEILVSNPKVKERKPQFKFYI
ncbi:hypothetical protein C5S32_09895 [ANME-1 cluster archaeon GoMg1]|nr:hypothetical protein [ANME-1 cluster archaeon GoMg1]